MVAAESPAQQTHHRNLRVGVMPKVSFLFFAGCYDMASGMETRYQRELRLLT